MSTEHFYEVAVQWSMDRKGIMSSPVLPDKIEVATPPEFPKGMENIWSPEHLLVAAVNEAIERSQTYAAQKLQGLTGGLGIPGF